MDARRALIAALTGIALTLVLIVSYDPLICVERPADAPICIEGEKPDVFTCEMNCDEGDGTQANDFALPLLKSLASAAIIATIVYAVPRFLHK